MPIVTPYGGYPDYTVYRDGWCAPCGWWSAAVCRMTRRSFSEIINYLDRADANRCAAVPQVCAL